MNYLHTYLIPQLLDFIPKSTHKSYSTSYKKIDPRLYIYSPRILRSEHLLYDKNCIIRNCDFHRGIYRNLRRWVNGFQACFRFVEKKKRFIFLGCRREWMSNPFNPQTISPTLVPSFADIVSFLSQECAIDRAAVARPLSPYGELGHFDVRSMRLTYWPICPGRRRRRTGGGGLVRQLCCLAVSACVLARGER